MSSETSAEVQKEAESERAELASTLDRLRENLRPENVVDEVMANAKVTTSEISDRIMQSALNNPIPAVLIGIGAAMLIAAGEKFRSRGSAAHVDYDRWTPRRTDHVGGTGQAATARLSSKLDALGSQASASASRIADSAASLRDQAKSTVTNYATSAREGLASVSGDQVMSQYSRSRDQMANSVSRLLDEQPLVLAALGVAVGAAIGAAIPATDAEARLMGDASASFKSRAQELAQAEYAHLKETASATLGDLKQSAADHGVSSDNLSDLIQDAGSKVRDAAHGVADHAAEAAKSQS